MGKQTYTGPDMVDGVDADLVVDEMVLGGLTGFEGSVFFRCTENEDRLLERRRREVFGCCLKLLNFRYGITVVVSLLGHFSLPLQLIYRLAFLTTGTEGAAI